MSATTGKVLWTHPCSKWGPGVKADVFVVGRTVWTHAADEHAAIGLDLDTGRLERKFSTAEAFDETHHHRCYRNKATERYLLCARRGIEFVDLQAEQSQTHHWVRGICRYGVMPCNGLVYVPPHPCRCYLDVKLSGFYALAAGESEGRDVRDEGRADESLQQGPAFGQIINRGSEIVDPPDWPTYRADARRTGATTLEVPAKLSRLWQAEFGGRISACTAAGGKVFVAEVDRHCVRALDARSGQPLWDYTTGGRVDTPPTIYRGLALFGSADGCVYCLRADDGSLIWRRRIVVEQRQIMAGGQLESAWPVHGTVLVVDGVAYVAAGRSTHLDGGVTICVLKPETGELIRTLPPLGDTPHGLRDVLTSDGRYVYMRHLKYALQAPPSDSEPTPTGRRAFSTAGLLDETAFSRVGWSTGGKGGSADLLVFDGKSTYTTGTRRSGGFGGWFRPATNAYELAAVDRGKKQPRWSARVPIRVRAMALTGETLWVAGPPDVAPADDPWAAFDGRRGGVLRAVSVGDGTQLAEYPLKSPPVFDGLAATGRRLLVSTVDGRVICMGPHSSRLAPRDTSTSRGAR